MSAIGNTRTKLGTAVANNATFTVSYPMGTNQALLAGSIGGQMALASGEKFPQAASGAGTVGFSFGASNITVTNRTGLPISGEVFLSFGRFDINGSYNLTWPRKVQMHVDGTAPGPAPDPVFASLLSGATWPTTPQAAPANLMPQPAGEFGTDTGWAARTGLTITGGVAQWSGAQTATETSALAMTSAMVAGRRYGYLAALSAFTSGAAFLGASTPGVQNVAGSGINETRHYTRLMTPTGAYANAHMQVPASAVLDVDYIRVYDITALLQKRWRIVFVYSQSNWVGTEDAADRLVNDPPEPRALVVPSLTNNIRGSALDGNGVGVPMLLVDPVVHMTISAGGPAGAFARRFCDSLRDDEVLVYVATGYSGGARMTTDGVWNRQNNGIAWANMLTQVNGTLANAPAGSTVAGMLFCQGEGDLTVNIGDQHTALIREDIEFLRGLWGNFPVVINEIGWSDRARADVANMVASQAKLDSNSGDPLALPRCRYLQRPAGSTFIADNLHYDQVTQRVRGPNAAGALLELNYGAPA